MTAKRPHLYVALTEDERADLERRCKEEGRTKASIVKRALWPIPEIASAGPA